MVDIKMTNQCAGHKNCSLKLQDLKMQDVKMLDMKMQDTKLQDKEVYSVNED